MAKFLSRDEVYRLISRELPEGVYAFSGSPEKHYTTADDDSAAEAASDAYANLSVIYDNYFPATTSEKIEDWEIKVFGMLGSAFDSLSVRRQNIENKIRAINGISRPIIRAKIQSAFDQADLISEDLRVVTPDWILETSGLLEEDDYLGFRDTLTEGFNELTFDLVQWCDESGSWVLDVSLLDVGTFLSLADPGMAPDLDCALDYVAAGITAQELEDIQQVAYTYEVRIHGHAEQRFLDYLENLLTKIEPARSTHYIYNDFPEPVTA